MQKRAAIRGPEAQAATPYQPDLFTKDEVRGFGCRFRSSDGRVRISNVVVDGPVLMVIGFVASDSRRGLYHHVRAPLGMDGGRTIMGQGYCRCESTHYHGRPCKHVLNMRNVYVRNRDRLNWLFGVPSLRTSPTIDG